MSRRLDQAITRTRRRHRDLQQLAHPSASEVFEVVRESESQRDRLLGEQVDLPMLLAWLGEIERRCDVAINQCAAALETASEGLDPPQRTAVLGDLKAGRYAEAMMLLGGKVSESDWERETAFRDEASRRYEDPRKTILDALSTDEEAQPLLDHWLRGIQGQHNDDQALKTKFAKLIFASSKSDKSNKPKGENDSKRFRVRCRSRTTRCGCSTSTGSGRGRNPKSSIA